MVLLTEGRKNGLVCTDSDGQLTSSVHMNDGFIGEIIKVRRIRPDLVTCDEEEFWELYNTGRLSRKGSQTRA